MEKKRRRTDVCYSEYLPVILGPEKMAEFGLNLGEGTTKYDPSVDPTVRTEFSTVITDQPICYNLTS